MHVVAEVHDTPLSSLPSAPLGLLILKVDHLLPADRSLTGRNASPRNTPPTATQTRFDGHDTAFSQLMPAREGRGTPTVRQLLPSQR